jgi:hypothetical protein
MKVVNARRTILLAALAVASAWAPAFAASQRTFVAVSGVDIGNCSPIAPCRTLGFALGQTIDGGEIVVLESGGYGPVAIGKSVSITAPAGVYSGISAFSGNAVTVNAASANVVLNGLTLTGLGADNGVAILAAASVRLDRCTISGFNADGVVAATGSGDIVVEHTNIRDNLGGIVVGGTHRLVVDDSTIEHNGDLLGSHFGVGITNSADVTVRRSRVVANASRNIGIAATTGETPRIEVTDSLLADSTGPGLSLSATGNTANIYAIASRNLVRNNHHGLHAEAAGQSTITLIATDNISTGNSGSWAYSATGSGATLVMSGNTASQSLFGVANGDNNATIKSSGNNVVQDAAIGATSAPPTLF